MQITCFRIQDKLNEMKRTLIAWMIFTTVGLAEISAQTTIRIACPYQQGTPVTNAIAAWAENIRTKTGGALRFELQASVSLALNEPGMVTSLEQGSLDAALLSAEGLARIDREFLALDLPFLITTENELIRVQTQMSEDLEMLLEKRGFNPGCWVNTGPSYFFTVPQTTDPSGLKSLKMAVQPNDAGFRSFLSKYGVNATTAGLPEVKPMLNTGAVNACLGNCINAARLEWNTKVRFMIDFPVRYGMGAFVIRTGFLQALADEHREIFTEALKELGPALQKAISSENNTAMRNITKHTVTRISFSEGNTKEMTDKATASWKENAGTSYSSSTLQKIRTILGK